MRGTYGLAIVALLLAAVALAAPTAPASADPVADRDVCMTKAITAYQAAAVAATQAQADLAMTHGDAYVKLATIGGTC